MTGLEKELPTYRTNASCRNCGHYLYTSDIAGYPLLCKCCDENMYYMETILHPTEPFKVRVPMKLQEYNSIIRFFERIAIDNHCHSYKYDQAEKAMMLVWAGTPSEEEIRKIIIGLETIRQEC